MLGEFAIIMIIVIIIIIIIIIIIVLVISSLLIYFVVAVETLAIAIRQNAAIKGISIGKEDTKLLQYADDTTAVLSDRDSAHALFSLLDVFRKLSALKINTLKSLNVYECGLIP